MAGFATRRSRFVEKHEFAVYRLAQGVTGGAGDVLMTSFQRECRLVVIEERRLPLVRVVASGAAVCPLAELIGVGILVAAGTACGRFGKAHVDHRQLQVRRPMAICACHGAMRPQQRELRPRMIEFGQVIPVRGRVAGLASQRLARGIEHGHPLRELSLVHVLVAGGAIEIAEMIKRQCAAGRRLMTLIARHCLVAAGKRKRRFLMFVQRVARLFECRSVVALFAAVPPWRSCELSAVLVAMTIGTLRKTELEPGFFPCGNMAGGAGHLFVRKDKWKLRPCVIRDREG